MKIVLKDAESEQNQLLFKVVAVNSLNYIKNCKIYSKKFLKATPSAFLYGDS